MGLSSVCLPAESINNLSPVGPWAALHKGPVTTAIGRNCSQRTLFLELDSSPPAEESGFKKKVLGRITEAAIPPQVLLMRAS